MDTFFQDLRFGARTLARRPLFTTIAVLTLGLGLGAATAMYSVVARVLIESVPFREPGRVVNVWQTAEGARGAPGLVGRTWDRLPMSFDQYRAWQVDNTAFEGIAVHNAVETTLTGQGPAERIALGIGSASLLSVLGVEPVLGRWFLPEEEAVVLGQASAVTVLSYETWQRRLGGDPGVLGRTLVLDGVSHTIVGVLPAGFRLRHLGMHWLGDDQRGVRDVWKPLGSALGNGNNLEAVARLAPGVSREQALSETRAILLAKRDRGEVRIVPRTEDETHGLSSPLLLLFGATGLVLVIACANIATLSLGELHGRRSELVTRSALGAGRRRLVGQLLTESLLLGALGTAVGALVALAGTRILVALAPPLPRVEAVGVDLRALGFAMSIGLLAVAAFGTLPAFLSARRSGVGLPATTRTATGRRTGSERWLVSLEIALTVVILVAGGLLGRSLQQLLAVDPGFDPDGLATVRVFIPQSGYPTPDDVGRAHEELVATIAAIPGISRASAITRLPFPGLTNTTTLTVLGPDGQRGPHVSAQQLYVAPGYHETMGIPLLAGEWLSSATPGGVLVNERIAREHWPTGSPVGVPVAMGRGSTAIVGIVGDEKRNALGLEADRAFYMALRPSDRDVSLVARTGGDARTVARHMRDAVRAYDPDLPVRQVTTLPDLIAASASQERYRTMLMTVFGALATLLAAVGVFGVTAQGVVRRTREMAIRMSLGAGEQRLVGRVVARALGTGAAGIAAGLIAAAWVGRWLAGMLFGVHPLDPPTYAIVAALVAAVCACASFVPARRIAGIDPARVLGAE